MSPTRIPIRRSRRAPVFIPKTSGWLPDQINHRDCKESQGCHFCQFHQTHKNERIVAGGMQTHCNWENELFHFPEGHRLYPLSEPRSMLFVIMLAILILILFLCISDFVLAPLLEGQAKRKASGLRTEEQRKSVTASIPTHHNSSGGP